MEVEGRLNSQASDDAIHVDELGSLSPLYDPGWHVQYERVSTVNKQMVRRTTGCLADPEKLVGVSSPRAPEKPFVRR